MPLGAITPGAVRIVKDGADPFQPVDPIDALFSTDFQGVGQIIQISQWSQTSDSILSIPLVDGPHSPAPMVLPLTVVPADLFNEDNESADALFNAYQFLVFGSAAASMHTFFCDNNNVYIDPLARREISGAPSYEHDGWVIVFKLGEPEPPGGGETLLGFRGGDAGLWIAREGGDVLSDDLDDLYYTPPHPVATVVDHIFVDTLGMSSGSHVDVGITDQGFKPALFFTTVNMVGGIVRHLDNSTLRCYTHGHEDFPAAGYNVWTFALALEGAP